MTERPSPNMSQRAVLQYLSMNDWKSANRLPIPAGQMMLSRLAHRGWIEIQGKDHRAAVSVLSSKVA
jgi:hypothetical protein